MVVGDESKGEDDSPLLLKLSQRREFACSHEIADHRIQSRHSKAPAGVQKARNHKTAAGSSTLEYGSEGRDGCWILAVRRKLKEGSLHL